MTETGGLPCWRMETPGCEAITHFNNAGASLMSAPAIEAVQAYHALEQTIGGYEAADHAATDLSAFYDAAAALIGAHPSEIAFKESATDAGQTALLAIDWKAGDRVLVHDGEYVSNLMALTWLQNRFGIVVDMVASLPTGEVDLEDLTAKITARTRCVCLTHIATFDGTVQPARDVGQIARAHGLLYILDACQSLGQWPIDVEAIGCDVLFGTGRKYLRGPRGTGVLYVRAAQQEAFYPLTDLRGGTLSGGQFTYVDGARRFERFEFSRAGQAGLATAIRYATDTGVAAIRDYTSAMADALRDEIRPLPGIEVYDRGAHRSAIVTFTGPFDPVRAVATLRAQEINTSVSHIPDAPPRLRASVHGFNDKADLQRLIEAVANLS